MKILIVFAILFNFFEGIYKPNPVPKARHPFTVIAHRGDHTVNPENTIEAYRQAINDKADYIEIDLRTTKDGQLISMHDGSINRTTNANGFVKDLTLGEIQKLKIRAKDSTDLNIYRVPMFEQILKLCKGKIYIYIDFKEAAAAQTLAMLKKYQMEKQVLVYINKPSQFTDWRNTDSTMPLMVSLPDSVKTIENLKSFTQNYHPDILDGNYDNYNREIVAYAHSLNLPVWPDAQSVAESSAVWDKALSLGLKGLQTDNPRKLVEYLKQRNIR